MPDYTAARIGSAKKGRARRNQCIEELKKNGGDLQAALAAIPVVYPTYKTWRRLYPQFAAEADMYKNKVVGTKTWTKGFQEFRRVYFKMESTWFHLQIVDALENGKPGSITMILIPPEHGKTTLLEDYCNYKLAMDPKFRIMVGSEGQNHTRKILRRVRNRMEPDGPSPWYVKSYGPFAPRNEGERHMAQPWSADFFDVYRRRSHDERDYNMAGAGITGNIAGTRTDLLIMDDVQSLRSLSLTEQMIDKFRQDWLSRPGVIGGRTVIIGTRVGDNDFYQALMDADLVDKLIKIPAHDVDGKWLWPERYTEEMYTKMRKNVGESAWARNYMQAPTAEGDETFTKNVIEKVQNPLRSVLQPAPKRQDNHETSILIGVDPAIGGGNATIACAATEQKLIVLDCRCDWGLTRTDQIMNLVEEYAFRYTLRGSSAVTDVIFETMAFQKGLTEDASVLELQSQYGFRISGHATNNSKYDENLGVAAMARSFLRGEIEIPWADDSATRNHMEPFISELEAWRPYKRGTKLRQDRVMALWFVWLRWRNNREGTTADPSQFSTKGLPYAQPKVLIGGTLR